MTPITTFTGKSARLTVREAQVLRHLADGLTTREIAEALHLSPRTVDVHRQNATHKLDARNATHAAILFDRARREVTLPEAT